MYFSHCSGKAFMNFLSHFYFHRHSRDPELVLGSVLPDLLKNANKSFRLQPYKYEIDFINNPKLHSLYMGWSHHLEIDRLFHNLPFFYEHTHELNILVAPLLTETPIRSSFFSHIALELLLDHLLLKEQLVYADDFYDQLAAVDLSTLHRFFDICGLENREVFFNFFDRFKQEQYIGSYIQMDQLTFALLQICRRVWNVQVDAATQELLTEALLSYVDILQRSYISVFEELSTV